MILQLYAYIFLVWINLVLSGFVQVSLPSPASTYDYYSVVWSGLNNVVAIGTNPTTGGYIIYSSNQGLS
jgi:hypothetical protein